MDPTREEIEWEENNRPTLNAAKDAFKVGDRKWLNTTPECAEYFLNVMPPIYFPGGFACSEPYTHDNTGRAVYLGFRTIPQGVQLRYATVAEFKTEGQSDVSKWGLTIPTVENQSATTA